MAYPSVTPVSMYLRAIPIIAKIIHSPSKHRKVVYIVYKGFNLTTYKTLLIIMEGMSHLFMFIHWLYKLTKTSHSTQKHISKAEVIINYTKIDMNRLYWNNIYLFSFIHRQHKLTKMLIVHQNTSKKLNLSFIGL